MEPFLSQLRKSNAKSGLFVSNEVSISYALGFPILDEMLGAVYIRKLPDGSIIKDVHRGIVGGGITMAVGQPGCGKTTGMIQMAANIVEPFGEKGAVIHKDYERSSSYDRIKVITGWDDEKIANCYNLDKSCITWENAFNEIVKIAEKKKAAGEEMMYHTGQYDIWGHEYVYWIPTVVIIDSLDTIKSEKELKYLATSESSSGEEVKSKDTKGDVGGLTSGSRAAIFNGMFFRAMLSYTYPFNINVFVINHMQNAMPDMTGKPKRKQTTFMPSGKYIPGGDKAQFYSSSIIYFNPHMSKDDIRTESENGWNGVPTDIYVIKSRGSKGGFSATAEFVQEAGFDPRITLMEFAIEEGLIGGRNPSRYFLSNPDVKFDTREIMRVFAERSEVIKALFEECRKPLYDLIPVVDTTNENDLVRNAKGKMMAKELLRNYSSEIIGVSSEE